VRLPTPAGASSHGLRSLPERGFFCVLRNDPVRALRRQGGPRTQNPDFQEHEPKRGPASRTPGRSAVDGTAAATRLQPAGDVVRVRDQLMTVRVMAHRKALAIGKDAIQIRGLHDRAVRSSSDRSSCNAIYCTGISIQMLK